MELMVGQAMFTAGTAGAVGSTGLFGAAGSFGAGGFLTGMGGSLLSGAMTAASAFSSIQAGKQQQQLLNFQANQTELNARFETLKGKEQAYLIKQQLNRDLASQNAMFGARGILAGEGSAAAAEKVSKQNATDDIERARFSSGMQANADRSNASNMRLQGRYARQGGYMNALTTLSENRKVNNLLVGY